MAKLALVRWVATILKRCVSNQMTNSKPRVTIRDGDEVIRTAALTERPDRDSYEASAG